MKTLIVKNNRHEPAKLASSPCAIDEADPEYMGLTGLDKKETSKEKRITNNGKSRRKNSKKEAGNRH